MQQVADWLEKLGLGQCAQRFAGNDISFAVLPDLTDQHLKEIGVTLGHRNIQHTVRYTSLLYPATSAARIAASFLVLGHRASGLAGVPRISGFAVRLPARAVKMLACRPSNVLAQGNDEAARVHCACETAVAEEQRLGQKRVRRRMADGWA
jgi:hypothetical protein